MNRQIRIGGYIVLGLFVALIVNLTIYTTILADWINNNPNNSLRIIEEFSIDRGPIVTADGTTLADSVETTDTLKYLRQYPQGDDGAHVTGYDSFIVGRSLSEEAFNDFLDGSQAPVTLQTIIQRLEGDLKGDQVNLSIIWDAQEAAIQGLGSRRGAAFAVDPKTGAVLVSASTPSYDPSVLSSHDAKSINQNWEQLNEDPDKPLLARAFRENYPPGSSFKIITAAAALEAGKTTLDTNYPTTTEWDPPDGKPIQNFAGEPCGGTLLESFAKSCNSVFAPLAVDAGAQKMYETANAFGFNQPVPFELGAVKSVYPDPSELTSQALLGQTGIGQFSVRETALQNSLVSAAIANGGMIMEPQILGSVTDEKGNTLRKMKPNQWLTATTQQVADDIKTMMIAVVTSGTGRSAAIPGIQVAGKTGTAQPGDGKQDHAWFTAFAPADDPKVAVAVIVENAGGGGSQAAPIAKSIIQAVLNQGDTNTNGSGSSSSSPSPSGNSSRSDGN